MCISSMYDLTPVQLSARSNYVKFDDATVAALSPIRHLDRLHAPLVVAEIGAPQSASCTVRSLIEMAPQADADSKC